MDLFFICLSFINMQFRFIGYKYKINLLKYLFYEFKVINYFIIKYYSKKVI